MTDVKRVRVPGYVQDSGVMQRRSVVIGDELTARLDLKAETVGVVAATSRIPPTRRRKPPPRS